MNFIRCNKCYESLKLTNPPFSLTQCGHIFCHKCTNNDNQCHECKTTGIESLPLTQPLPNRVTSLFMPASELLEQSLFTWKFQHAQMMISIRRLDEIERKYNGIKMAYWKLRKHTEELTKAHRNLQESQTRCQTTQKVIPEQRASGFVNVPRSYFNMNNYQQSNSQRNVNIRPGHLVERQSNIGRAAVRFNMNIAHDGYQTDDSMSSISANRMNELIETPPITPDAGIFRIPNIRNLPRSTGTSSGNRSHSNTSNNNTPLSHKTMF